MSTRPTIFGYGEAMIRYAPTSSTATTDVEKGQPELYLRSIGGDELNVMVALARISYSAHWVSVLPNQVLGNVVKTCANGAGVSTKYSQFTSANSEVGSFTVLPKEKRVHYRRASSAFWKDKHNFDWDKIIKEMKPSWCHATGITPLCGDNAAISWVNHVDACGNNKIPISIDFNHRPALGTLEKLWNLMQPIIKQNEMVKLLIFSLKTLRQVSLLCGVEDVPEASIFEHNGGTASRNNMNKRQKLANGNSSVGISESNPVWHELMERLFNKLGGRVNIACCFKTRDSNGVQTRWSTIVDSNGIHNYIFLCLLYIHKVISIYDS